MHVMKGCLPALTATALLGCASAGKVSSVEIEGANLAARQNFAWQNPQLVQQGGDVTPELARQIDATIRQHAIEELVRKGYVQTSESLADFIVTYQIIVTDRSLVERRDPAAPSPSGSVGPGDPLDILRDAGPPSGIAYESEGSVLVMATDNESGRILWRGSIEGAVTNPAQVLRFLPGDIRRMFEGFPVRAATSP